MAGKKTITNLSELTTAASGDVMPVVDISDQSVTSSGETKKITVGNLLSGKADLSHTHSISDVTSLQTSLDAKQDNVTAGDGLSFTGATLNAEVTQAELDAKSDSTHTHTASEVTDFDTEVANNSAVTANTAKVSNATHTGDATGSTALTVEKIQGRSVSSTAPSDGQVLKWVDSASEWQPSTDNTGSGGGGGGSGTVTSVAISGSDGIDVDSGSPVTSSGTIALGLSNIGDAAISSAATWNAKQDAVTAGTGLSFTGSTLNAEVTQAEVDAKQDTVTAGTGLSFTGSTLNAEVTQSEVDAKQDTVTAGTGLSFTGATLNAEVTQSEVDAKQDTLTFGIANTNAVKVDAADVADDEYARFTANGLESRSTSEVLSDIGAAASSHNHSGVYEPADATILKDADIGSTVQAYDADTAKLDVDQAWTGSQRSAFVTDNDGSFDMDAGQNFKCTPTALVNFTFTNITDGQSGYILLVNGSAYAHTKSTTLKASSTLLTDIGAAGTFLVSYIADGTNVYLTSSQALS